MTNIDKNRNLILSAFFIALGILIPMLFHFVGLGPMLLPMFWPVAISAFFLPLSYSVLVGLLTPIISTLMTGMPPPPILYKMIFELGCLSSIINVLYHKTRWGTFWIIFFALFCTMAAGLLGAYAIAPIFGFPPELYAIAALLKNLPGLLIMIVFIPIFLNRIIKEYAFKKRT